MLAIPTNYTEKYLIKLFSFRSSRKYIYIPKPRALSPPTKKRIKNEKHILKLGNQDKCRNDAATGETIQHNTSKYLALAGEVYLRQQPHKIFRNATPHYKYESQSENHQEVL